jgi:hypothetical protein
MSGDFDDIYRELVQRHGSEALGAADRAIIRRLAVLLSGDDLDHRDAATIAALKAMLPSPAGDALSSPMAWDLSRLSDAEVGQLFELAQIATRQPIMDENGALNVPAPPRESAVEETLRRAAEQLKELTAERDRRRMIEHELDEQRSRAARLEGEVARLQNALADAAHALERAKAVAADGAFTASPGAPGRNVVAMPRRLSPAERFDSDRPLLGA